MNQFFGLSLNYWGLVYVEMGFGTSFRTSSRVLYVDVCLVMSHT